jgi:hypothetical protein
MPAVTHRHAPAEQPEHGDERQGEQGDGQGLPPPTSPPRHSAGSSRGLAGRIDDGEIGIRVDEGRLAPLLVAVML